MTLAWPWLVLSLLAAAVFGAGLYYLQYRLRQWSMLRRIESIQGRSIRSQDFGRREAATSELVDEVATRPSRSSDGIVVESIRIRNFKNIEELELDLARESALTGAWNCIAGINGAGKTSILQALCLVLLGSDLVIELGRVRLRRMLRRTADGTFDAEIEAVVRHHGTRQRLYLPLMSGGVDEETLRRQDDYPQMRQTWAELRHQVLVSYGASRNVSDYRDPRHASISKAVQRQMTLFDPLTQIASVDVLLEGGREVAPALETLYLLLRVVLGEQGLMPERSEGGSKLRFSVRDTALDVIDLPDGFRSTVAWLADLCAAWHDRPDGERADPDPTSITGTVLLDEIGLHLHPSLEKSLVPQLRRALPNVQFIVSTHSPLVLSSFDRSELIVLDSSSSTGTRRLDRQVFGFSTDEIYEWLMDTSPGSQVMQEMLEESQDPELAVYLYQSKDVNEDLARKILADRKKQIARLESEAPKS